MLFRSLFANLDAFQRADDVEEPLVTETLDVDDDAAVDLRVDDDTADALAIPYDSGLNERSVEVVDGDPPRRPD